MFVFFNESTNPMKYILFSLDEEEEEKQKNFFTAVFTIGYFHHYYHDYKFNVCVCFFVFLLFRLSPLKHIMKNVR